MTAQPVPNPSGPMPVHRTVCSSFADVLRILRRHLHAVTVEHTNLTGRDEARDLIDKRLAEHGRPVYGTVVVTSRQGRLLAFDGEIRAATGMAIEFTTGARAPLHRLVAVGIN
ncbi:hypothetical protein [Dietzia sp. 179-F 9C3 NHS]|uniref:hypothetical protein n=1 Tax=Dietzia sp. 179-F 9C3 NHS TaxID=3374295 RepID=UPI003879C42E